MSTGSLVFSQITATIFPSEFSRCAQTFPTTRSVRNFSQFDHFLALCFGQLTYRESLRDIVTCLQSKKSKLYRLGFRGHITRTNLAYASKNRDWRLFAAVAQVLMRKASRLYQNENQNLTPDVSAIVFALDSSLIHLGLDLFPWGYWARTGKAALKLHLMLSLKGQVPAWAMVTQADFSDLKALDHIPLVPGAFYVMDRAYLDFVRLYRHHCAGAFFVVRCKHHVRFGIQQARPVDKEKGLRCDQTVRLTSNWSKKSFPHPLRRISIHDEEHHCQIVLLTNNFEVPAHAIGQLYLRRWDVELFFKWIKQHLRVRSFYGRSENAVRCQIWCAISAYLMVAILKKQLNVQKSLYEILQIISVNAFEQVPLAELLGNNEPDNQINTSQNIFSIND